ncbi:hypothetical protein K469DRAFT_705949 [Zopfia rhizophila CBS 207.26]|uniref:Uncharacterized protein n=1 Tax=Zopfia rhizophila CBS 207.26 TaxID=1314779 RepID=A0A6A6EUQ1_9PEZI|nr:hypothetical protein K469DRAFT_705949 [Zopfia rhizophila CBS 207.26]
MTDDHRRLAYNISLSSKVYSHEATKILFREVASSSFLSNNIMSLRKEVAQGDLDSIIPILIHYHQHTPQ